MPQLPADDDGQRAFPRRNAATLRGPSFDLPDKVLADVHGNGLVAQEQITNPIHPDQQRILGAIAQGQCRAGVRPPVARLVREALVGCGNGRRFALIGYGNGRRSTAELAHLGPGSVARQGTDIKAGRRLNGWGQGYTGCNRDWVRLRRDARDYRRGARLHELDRGVTNDRGIRIHRDAGLALGPGRQGPRDQRQDRKYKTQHAPTSASDRVMDLLLPCHTKK